jgi:hypothetical protein
MWCYLSVLVALCSIAEIGSTNYAFPSSNQRGRLPALRPPLTLFGDIPFRCMCRTSLELRGGAGDHGLPTTILSDEELATRVGLDVETVQFIRERVVAMDPEKASWDPLRLQSAIINSADKADEGAEPPAYPPKEYYEPYAKVPT